MSPVVVGRSVVRVGAAWTVRFLSGSRLKRQPVIPRVRVLQLFFRSLATSAIFLISHGYLLNFCTALLKVYALSHTFCWLIACNFRVGLKAIAFRGRAVLAAIFGC